MKIQNTIAQPQLEMLLRLANAMHSGNPAWRYGQSVFNAAQTILPDLAEEIRGNPEVDPFNWPEDHGARWTKWYAAVCPDPPKEESGYETAYKHYGQSEKEDEWEEHEVCAYCQSIGITLNNCICTYAKDYATVKRKFKKCSHCGHVDDTSSYEQKFDTEYTDEEVQELDEMTQKAIELKKTVLDLTNSFTKKHK